METETTIQLLLLLGLSSLFLQIPLCRSFFPFPSAVDKNNWKLVEQVFYGPDTILASLLSGHNTKGNTKHLLPNQ